MNLFRRREPLHVRLARAGETAAAQDTPLVPWDAAGIHGIPRAREWDYLTTVAAPELEGERAEFVCVSPGRIVVLEGPPSPQTLAAAAEAGISPPFRAEAVRRHGDLWAVAARRVELVQLPGVEGDELELVSHQGVRTLAVDGEHRFGTLPPLERDEHVVRARRLEDDLWEVESDPL